MKPKPGDVYYDALLDKWRKLPKVEAEPVEPWRRLRDSWQNEVDNENANDRNRR